MEPNLRLKIQNVKYLGTDKFDEKKHVFSVDEGTYDKIKTALMKGQTEGKYYLPIRTYEDKNKKSQFILKLKLPKDNDEDISEFRMSTMTIKVDFYHWDYLGRQGTRAELQSYEHVVIETPKFHTYTNIDDLF
jgi:hypothetical protein